jgi:hypothetical protein
VTKLIHLASTIIVGEGNEAKRAQHPMVDMAFRARCSAAVQTHHGHAALGYPQSLLLNFFPLYHFSPYFSISHSGSPKYSPYTLLPL